MQGRLDSALTALGRVQAARQGAILRGQPAMPTLCSPLGRARLTAAMAGLDAQPEPRLAEIEMGKWQGLRREEVTLASGILWKFAAPDGEGIADLQDRLNSLLSDLAGPTILVTHGVISIALRAMLRGLPSAAWDDLDDPQGVVHRVEAGRETLLI